MRSVKSPKLSRTATMIGIAVVCVIIVFFSYPFAIAEFAGKNMPAGWEPELGEMNLGQIHKEIGPPAFSMSAKEYQDWVKYHWWGVEILKIMAVDCCGQNARPSDIQYIVYVKGRAKPVRVEFIFQSTKN